MERLNEFKEVKFVEEMPAYYDYGVLYVSKKHGCVSHRCPCGCGHLICIPIDTLPWGSHDVWHYEHDGNNVTLSPSLLNSCPNKAHYFIRNNKIIWI